jgi:hypothetical protein
VENFDCGIAASAHPGIRGKKNQISFEIQREDLFFPTRARAQAQNHVLDWLAWLEAFGFLQRITKLANLTMRCK